jgi:hypothetical protein
MATRGLKGLWVTREDAAGRFEHRDPFGWHEMPSLRVFEFGEPDHANGKDGVPFPHALGGDLDFPDEAE